VIARESTPFAEAQGRATRPKIRSAEPASV
jgi:hypothetical protein